MKASELFKHVRTRLALSQAEMADRIDISPRSYTSYERGEYDQSESAAILKVITRVKSIKEELDRSPAQVGDNNSITAQLAVIRNEIRDIKDRLLPTMEAMAKALENATKGS